MQNNDKEIQITCTLTQGESLSVLDNVNPISYASKKAYIKKAEEIDKSDMFDHLQINDQAYAFKRYESQGEELYIGIPHDENLHGESPIFDYQINAVKKFLGNFRGVGILADEVGMGKTIEAGMIISELAERKVASSLLIVGASADNCNDWIKTMGEMFGLLNIVKVSTIKDIKDNCARLVPQVPMIIQFSDFCDLPYDIVSSILFDIIVLDEAHNLDNSNVGKSAMSVLQGFMKIKKENNKPYCILISGTPHKGNLDSMFPLWYFIKGGNDEKKALANYKEFLCNGASTIAEYIESFRINSLKGNPEFESHCANLLESLKVKYPKTYGDVYKKQIVRIRQDYFEKYADDPTIKKINNNIKNSYKKLLESFMIRQSRRLTNFRGVSKYSTNYYFVPIKQSDSTQTVQFKQYNVSFTKQNNYDFQFECNDFYSDNAITYNDQIMSLNDFVNAIILPKFVNNKKRIEMIKKTIIFDALAKLLAFTGEKIGESLVSEKYYRDNFINNTDEIYDKSVQNYFEIINGKEMDLFAEKAEKFAKVVEQEQYANNKIIVFFDYYDPEKIKEREALYSYMQTKYPRIAERIICLENDDRAADIFAGKICLPQQNLAQSENGILFATEKLSESSNFQFCSTIINFSICYSPIKMDQRIGRVDRIGQMQDMNIISFASMDKLEGYLLSFFNKIELFSGWKDDIILVTGCDNKNHIPMKCKECNKIIRGTVDNLNCPFCGTLESLTQMDSCFNYKCPSCDTQIMRTQSQNKTEGDGYKCGNNKKAIMRKYDDNVFYMCSKKCVLLHCRLAERKNCKAYIRLLEDENTNINELIEICDNCQEKICDNCHISIDAKGYDIISGEKMGDGCLNCPTNNLKCKFVMDTQNVLCPTCKTKMQPIVPATFDEFVQLIWSEPTFIDDFDLEIKKITSIVKTFRGD